MNKTFVFAGASSKTAIETAKLLQAQQHKVIGISTKPQSYPYDEFHVVDKYTFGTFPEISQSIDGLVYFPGTIQLKPFQRISEAEFFQDYHINTLGAVAFTQMYMGELKKRPGSAVVFVSSVAAQTGLPFHSSIAMAKAALEGLTKSLAAEFAPTVRVNAIAPSLTQTPLAEKFVNTPDKLDASHKRHPLKRIGEAVNLANAIHFLLDEKSSWITGQVMAVDGGMSQLRLI